MDIKATLWKVWKVVRVVGGVLIVAYVLFIIAWIPVEWNRQETADRVEKIRNTKIVLEDALTKNNLPPEPSEEEANATIEGLDLNLNGIRDDVEWKIFRTHYDSAKTRAAELQYAKALQLYLTDVFNEETWKEASRQEDRGYFCINELFDDRAPDKETATQGEWNDFFALGDALTNEVEGWVFNTEGRQEKKRKIFEKYITTTSSGEEPYCDLVLKYFSN